MRHFYFHTDGDATMLVAGGDLCAVSVAVVADSVSPRDSL